MINGLPFFVSVVFMATTLLTFILLNRVISPGKVTSWAITVWLLLTGGLALSGWLTDTTSLPPRPFLLIAVPLLVLSYLFSRPKGKKFLATLDIEQLTWIHVVRVPVELVLYWLAIYKQIPELMTFEGRNFDIVAGLTAPLIIYFGIRKKMLSAKVIIAWNALSLVLLFNIVINAIISIPSPIQQQAFDQPNVGILFFPFAWLPAFIVPAVLFAHLATLRLLIKKK